MYQDINLLILDEPTNHLDIDSCEVLEEALEQFNGTIVAVSHDRYFLNKLFEKIYWIEDGKIHFFDGNYDWAKEKLTIQTTIAEIVPEVAKTVKTKPKLNKKPEKNAVQLENLEQKLEEIEAEIYLLKQQMESVIDLELLQKFYLELENKEKERDQLYSQLDEVV
jgi:ABC-type multidrug transport system ATPase subunit